MLSQPDAHAQCLAARAGTHDGPVADVGFCTMGGRGDTAAGLALHQVVRLEMGLRELCSLGARVVRRISDLVQRRSGTTSRRKRS